MFKIVGIAIGCCSEIKTPFSANKLQKKIHSIKSGTPKPYFHQILITQTTIKNKFSFFY